MTNREGHHARAGEPEDSAAFRADYMVGRLTRTAVIIFVFAVGGLAIGGGLAPERWQTTITVGSVAFGLLAVVSLAVARRNAFWAAVGSYVLLVGAGSFLQSMEPKPRGALLGVAVGTILSALAFMVLSVGAGRRRRELERMLFTESTSTAFFATMIAAITYALLEAWLDAPKVSMWIVWSVGMGVWAIASIVLGRKYS